jgi:hypothetical protein
VSWFLKPIELMPKMNLIGESAVLSCLKTINWMQHQVLQKKVTENLI